MIDNIIKMMIIIAVIVWISFTLVVIIPKIEGVYLIPALTLVIGTLGTIFVWLEKIKKDKDCAAKAHELSMLQAKQK
ncbi:MAG: hypothetical protein QM489_00995 [Candidatus Izemoplasma sp.]